MLSSLLLTLAMPSMVTAYTLPIFGNANMDDVVDEKDLDLLQAMINGSESESELADADADGDIDGDDLVRVEEIIRGDPTKITLNDSAGRIVTVDVPVERVIPLQYAPRYRHHRPRWQG